MRTFKQRVIAWLKEHIVFFGKPPAIVEDKQSNPNYTGGGVGIGFKF